MATHTTHSIVKAFDLLHIACCLPRSSSLRDVAAEADISLATTHRILTTLKSLGAIQIAADGRYVLGRKLSELRNHEIAERAELRALIEHRLAKVGADLGMSVRLSALDSQKMLCFVAGSDAPGDPTAKSRRIGGRFEAYLHAPGKLLLAQLGPSGICDYLAGGLLIGATPKTITDPKRLFAELRHSAMTGYAVEDEEFELGEEALAVPLVDVGGTVVAAVSASRRIAGRRGFGQALDRLRWGATAIATDLSQMPRSAGSVSRLIEAIA